MRTPLKVCAILMGQILLTGLLTSCTAEQVYNNFQQDHQRHCLLLPIWQQEHCLSLNDVPYHEYQRERET
jgi:hypothetical protein